MKKSITPKMCKGLEKKRVVAPSAETLDFIKQFARSYYVEKRLPISLSEICVN